MTELVHGGKCHIRPAKTSIDLTCQYLLVEEAVRRAEVATQVLYNYNLQLVPSSDIIGALKGDPRLKASSETEVLNTTIVELAAMHGLVSSRCKPSKNTQSLGTYITQ